MSQLLRTAIRLVPWSLRSYVKHVPGLAQLQRAVVARGLDGKELVHKVDAGPAKGMTFPIRLPDDKGIWTGNYEVDFAKALAKATRPGMIAYDIGSWHGFFSGVMSAQGAAQVFAFEPLPDNLVRLNRFVELNPGRSIKVFPCAIGDADGEAKLRVLDGTSMAKLEASGFQPSEKGLSEIPVKVRTIDTLVMHDHLPPPDLIKIDVEGAEMMVLKGGVRTLSTARPAIFMEAHSQALLVEVKNFLGGLGYELQMLDRDEGAARSRDVFQIKAEAT